MNQLLPKYFLIVNQALHTINENKVSFEFTVSSIQSEAALKNKEITSGYEKQIADLQTESTTKHQELVTNYEGQISELLNLATADAETVKAEYEARLSNTLIHSNDQNSKLTEDLNKFVLENEHFKEKIREMITHIDEQNTKIEDLCREISRKWPHIELIGGGGVRALADLRSLRAAGCRGALVASALHDGRLSAADLAAV